MHKILKNLFSGIIKMKNNLILLPLVFITLTGCHKVEDPIVEIFTSEGNIKIELYQQKAPNTVDNFLAYADSAYYDDALFYRTVKKDNQPNNKIKIEVIQGGLGFSDTDIELPPIHHESTLQTGISHLDGTISMARADTGSVTSEFFICIGDQPELDYDGQRNPDRQGFSAFGRVIEGMDVVRLIHNLPDMNQIFIHPVKIDSIRRLK